MARTLKLVFALAACTAMLATLAVTGQAQPTNKIQTEGNIRLYQSDGQTELEKIDFPLFTPSTPETFAKKFYVKNTGPRPTQIAWQISESNIAWTPKTTHQASGYVHNETGQVKYSLRIRHAQKSHGSFLAPEKPSLTVKPGEAAQLVFELAYSGTPATAETFTLTTRFTAADPQKPAPRPHAALPSPLIFTHTTLANNWLTKLLNH